MIAQALLHGAALSAFMTAIIFGSLWHDPRIWTRSLPKDAQALAGPVPPETQRRKRLWSLPMVLGLAAVFAHLAHAVGSGGFVVTATAAFIAFEVFNLYDAVVLDLGLVLVRPRFALIPGTENAKGFRDPRWHLGNYVRGVVLGVPFALLIAALDAGVRRLAG